MGSLPGVAPGSSWKGAVGAWWRGCRLELKGQVWTPSRLGSWGLGRNSDAWRSGFVSLCRGVSLQPHPLSPLWVHCWGWKVGMGVWGIWDPDFLNNPTPPRPSHTLGSAWRREGKHT